MTVPDPDGAPPPSGMPTPGSRVFRRAPGVSRGNERSRLVGRFTSPWVSERFLPDFPDTNGTVVAVADDRRRLWRPAQPRDPLQRPAQYGGGRPRTDRRPRPGAFYSHSPLASRSSRSANSRSPSPRRAELSARPTRRPRSARPAAHAATQMTAATVARAGMRCAPMTTPYSARTSCQYSPRQSSRSTPRMRATPAIAAVSRALILRVCIGRPTARSRTAGAARARALPPLRSRASGIPPRPSSGCVPAGSTPR